MYQQHQSQHLSMSSLSIPHIHASSPASSGSGTPAFWPKDKLEGC
jgi:hypothetical protein